MNLTICLLVARTFIPKDADPAGGRGLPRPHRRGVRPDVRPGQGRAARPRRPDRARHRSTRASTTRSATGSAGPSFELPEISLEADEAADHGAGGPGLAARQPGHGDDAGAAQAARRRSRRRRVGADDHRAAARHRRAGLRRRVRRRDPADADQLRPPAAPAIAEPTHAAPRAVGDRVVARPLVRRRPRPRPRAPSGCSGSRGSRARSSRIGEPHEYEPPADLDLRALAASLAPPHPHSSATRRVRARCGRRAAPPGRHVPAGSTSSGPRSSCPTAAAQSLADELMSYGPDVVVMEPDRGPRRRRSGA